MCQQPSSFRRKSFLAPASVCVSSPCCNLQKQMNMNTFLQASYFERWDSGMGTSLQLQLIPWTFFLQIQAPLHYRFSASTVTVCLQKCDHSVWNCHLLVWPIYQAQSLRLSSNVLKNHHNLRKPLASMRWNTIIIYSNHLPPKVWPLRMKLPLTRMTHIPSSIIKIIINFVETPS